MVKLVLASCLPIHDLSSALKHRTWRIKKWWVFGCSPVLMINSDSPLLKLEFRQRASFDKYRGRDPHNDFEMNALGIPNSLCNISTYKTTPQNPLELSLVLKSIFSLTQQVPNAPSSHLKETLFQNCLLQITQKTQLYSHTIYAVALWGSYT